MKTDIKKLPKSKMEITVEVSYEDLRPYVEQSLNEFAKATEIKGFRPGKAPKQIVEREVGAMKIYQEGAILAIKKLYPQIISDNKIEAIGEPKIEITKLAPENPLEFKAEITVLPEIKLGDYQKIREKKNKVEITDERVGEELKKLQASRAKLVTVRRPAQKGDRVEVDFTVRVEGVKIEGGESRNHPLTIGEGHFVPGFEDNLVGLKEGDAKKFNLAFPKDYYKKELADKSAEFDVKMIVVQEKVLDELNDEFAKNLGKFKDLADLKNSIKEGLTLEEQEKETERVRFKIIEQVVNASEIETPELLVHAEIHKMLDEYAANIENMGIKFETYLAKIGKTVDDLEKEWEGQAEKRVKINLALREIANREKIEAADKEMEEEINKVLATFHSVEEAEQKIDMERLKEYTRGMIMNRKVFELLEKIASK